MSNFLRPPLPEPALVQVTGVTSAPFDDLREAFARAIAAQGGGGAALSVHHNGRHVVDLVGGTYSPDTLQSLFSVTKSISAIAATMAEEDGDLDLDEPIAAHWAAFAKPSTSMVTTRMVLSHRSGLASFDRPLSFEELLEGADEAAIERQEPFWEPDTAHGYHAFTFGTILNGVFKRVLGETVSEYVRQRIAAPLGLDLWIGLPAEQRSRVAPVDFTRPATTELRVRQAATSTIPPGVLGPLMARADIANDERMYTAEWPAGSGVADARSLSALFSAVIDGHLLGDEALRRMKATKARGVDRVLGIPIHYGSGVQLPFSLFPQLGPSSFGQEGAGGSAVSADPDRKVAVAWTTNVYPSMAGVSPPFSNLFGTVRHCLDSDLSPV